MYQKMNEVLLTNLGILVGLIPVGVLLGWGLLRGLDKLSGVRFEDAFGRISEDPKALAVYYGARFIGVMYLTATLAGRFI